MTDKTRDAEVGTSRRSFLTLAGVGTATAAAALATAKTAEAATMTADGSGDYRETEHVRTYYDSARF